MIAIHTKFLPVTNTKGARIKAYTASGFTVTVSYDYAASEVKAHYAAVEALKEKHKLEWPIADMVYGDSSDNLGYTFCFAASSMTLHNK